jgi:ABC-type nitrate/sulfonate/bicarbonate transport system substrate-binding protein
MSKATWAVLATVIMASSIGQASAATVDTLRYGMGAGGGLGRLPITIGLRQGFYEREGLRLELVRRQGKLPMDTVNMLLDALAEGKVDVVPTQLDFMAVRAAKGADFVAIAGSTINPVYTLISRPEIRTFADLRGKTVGLTLVDDEITLSMRMLMENHGVKSGEVRLLDIQGSQPRFDCMVSGECAATVVAQPLDFDAVARGYHRLGISNEVGPLLFTVDTITRQWGRAHRDIGVRYVRASAAILRFISNPMNRAAVRPFVMELAGVNQARADEILNDYYDPNKHVIAHEAEIDQAALERNIALMDKYEKLPKPHPSADQLVDRSYWTAALSK